ncbi:MAG: MBL fold metallo-hydrolase [Chitinophagia bacterium]|nr:MBL fold metallo-hydrolase [Chitinophagia bacterium]
MIKAFKKDNELLKDIADVDPKDKYVHLWWLGQSGYLIQYKGKRILVDPYLSDSLTEKYKDSDKPHVRISEKVIDPSKLPTIDFITSSHNHTDHLDAFTINPILKNSLHCKMIIPEANRAFVAQRLGLDPSMPIGLNAGEHFSIEDIEFHAIPAAHNTLEKNTKGEYHYLGYIIRLGNFVIYHSGDTLYYEGMEEWINQFNPTIALLPINGNDPARKVAGNLNAEEAVKLSKQCNFQIVIPCHYDLFEFNTADVNEFIQAAKQTEQRFCILELGGKFSSCEV